MSAVGALFYIYAAYGEPLQRYSDQKSLPCV